VIFDYGQGGYELAKECTVPAERFVDNHVTLPSTAILRHARHTFPVELVFPAIISGLDEIRYFPTVLDKRSQSNRSGRTIQ
jgi:hypothetical protein